MAEIDLKKVPFADWLEQAIPALCQMPARCIGMVAILEDGAKRAVRALLKTAMQSVGEEG